MSGVIDTSDRRKMLHAQLDEMLDWQVRLLADETDERVRSGWARILLSQAVELARRASGDEIIAEALLGIDDQDRSSAIQGIERQMAMISELFEGVVPSNSAASLRSAVDELRAIRSGDEPRLFARLPGRKVPFRVAHAKLDAVTWDAYLAAKGDAPHVRHSLIASAFGHEWDTISRWRADVSKVLGDEQVRLSVRDAEMSAKHGFKRFGSIAESGREYKAAMGFSVA